jgi:hypothetical protein
MVRTQTKSDSTPARISGGASRGSAYSKEASLRLTMKKVGNETISPDCVPAVGKVSSNSSAEKSETNKGLVILKCEPVNIAERTAGSSFHLPSKLKASWGEQFIYDSFVEMYGVFQANHLADEFDWKVTREPSSPDKEKNDA